jgi:hypothetical protein
MTACIEERTVNQLQRYLFFGCRCEEAVKFTSACSVPRSR